MEINLSVLGDGFAKGIGDPTLQGWADRLVARTVQELGTLNYYNLGIGGETSVAVVARIRELVPRKVTGQDNRLIFSFGLNDTEEQDGKPRLTNQESTEALKQLIIKTRNHFKLLMVGLPPVYEPQRNARIKRLNSLQRELCQKAHVPFIDIYSSLSDDVQYKRSLRGTDRIYPDAQGYEKVFELIWNDRSWWFNQ